MVAGPRLKKEYGQHHLRHAELCRPLLDFLRPGGATVVEIGPGGGLLSGELMRAGARVWAWELDPEWAFRLSERPGGGPVMVIGDALDIPWERLREGTQVAGNLPYAVATRLIQDLLERGGGVRRAGFLVQAEVADRLTASAGEGAYGALSVLVQARAEVRLLARVRRGSFRPPPKVDGAFVGLRRRPTPLPPGEWPAFERLVRLAFGQRRKTLRNALAARWRRGQIDALLQAVDLTPLTRATEMDLERHLALYRAALSLGLLST